MENKDKRFTLKIRGQEIEISEEVYRAYIRPVQAEQRRKRRAQHPGQGHGPQRDAVGRRGEEAEHRVGRAGRARDGQHGPDAQVDDDDKARGEPRGEAPAQALRPAGARRGDDAEHREQHGGGGEADEGRYAFGTCRIAGEGRENQVPGAKEHREQRGADQKALPVRETLHTNCLLFSVCRREECGV